MLYYNRNLMYLIKIIFIFIVTVYFGCDENTSSTNESANNTNSIELNDFAPNTSDFIGNGKGEERLFDTPQLGEVDYPACEQEFCNCYELEGDPNPDDLFICNPGNDHGADICGWNNGKMMSGKSSFSLNICSNQSATGWGCSYRDGIPGCEKFDQDTHDRVGGFFEKSNGYYTECKQGIYMSCSEHKPSWKGLVSVRGCWKAPDFNKIEILNGNPHLYEITPWPTNMANSWIEVVDGDDNILASLCESSSTVKSVRSDDSLMSHDVELTDERCIEREDLIPYCKAMNSNNCGASALEQLESLYAGQCGQGCTDDYLECMNRFNCRDTEDGKCAQAMASCCLDEITMGFGN